MTFYDEIALPPEARRIPTTRLALPEAAAVLAEWRAGLRPRG